MFLLYYFLFVVWLYFNGKCYGSDIHHQNSCFIFCPAGPTLMLIDAEGLNHISIVGRLVYVF